LECIAFDNDAENIILSVIEARKNAWFYAFFRNRIRLTEDKDGDFTQIANEIINYNENITIKGSSAALLYDLLPKKNIYLSPVNYGYAEQLISIAKINNLLDNSCSLYSGPEYIRKTDAEINLLAAQS
jgi:tRNA A37 threonylcarbamoyladenosine modification protein TsaB